MQHEGACLWLQLYTQDFYRDVVKPKLNSDGIFVTQSGPAGVLSSTEVFTAIHKTLQSAFPAVVPYAQHIPSYNDAWVSASKTAVEHVMHLLDTSHFEPVASTSWALKLVTTVSIGIMCGPSCCALSAFRCVRGPLVFHAAHCYSDVEGVFVSIHVERHD